MVPVSLYDVIEICKLKRTSNPAGARITVNCDHPLVPSGEKNIVYGAARMLMQQAGADQPIHIQIRKRIPVGAGLGGGSSLFAVGRRERVASASDCGRYAGWRICGWS